jgi:uncharacterized membrane protein YgcG
VADREGRAARRDQRREMDVEVQRLLARLGDRADRDAQDRDAGRQAAAAARQASDRLELQRGYIRKIQKADGTALPAVRRWFRDVHAVHAQQQEIAIEVVAQTATGPLYDELERLIGALAARAPAVLRPNARWEMVEEDLRVAILGPADEATLRQELERSCQATHETAHEFGTRFLAESAEAYPGVRGGPLEETLVRIFVRGLTESGIREELAIRRPPPTIRNAVTSARELEARYALLRPSVTEKRRHVSAIGSPEALDATEAEKPSPPAEDPVVAALKKQIDRLSTAVGEMKKGVRPGDATRLCYNCDRPGHFARECRAAPRGGPGPQRGRVGFPSRGRGGFRGRGGQRGGFRRGGGSQRTPHAANESQGNGLAGLRH